jgi:uncharacterized protein (DUF302 family)
MSQVGSRYTVSTRTELAFEQAVARVREELAPYLILGACNPPLAHGALEAEPELGVLLPCNVVVYEEQGQTHIAAVDAKQMLSIVGNDKLTDTASEVRRSLSAVVERAAQTSADSPA